MKTFELTGMITVSVYTKVEAETLEEAIEIAYERTVERFEWGNDAIANYSWLNEDYDGEVFEIKES